MKNNGNPPYTTAVGLQADGSVIVGGKFSILGGLSHNSLGRLTNTTSDNGILHFRRRQYYLVARRHRSGGLRTSFEASTNGVDWFSLGDGTRINGGWTLDGLDLPPNATIRARLPNRRLLQRLVVVSGVGLWSASGHRPTGQPYKQRRDNGDLQL